jgi:hypothetical protein
MADGTYGKACLAGSTCSPDYGGLSCEKNVCQCGTDWYDKGGKLCDSGKVCAGNDQEPFFRFSGHGLTYPRRALDTNADTVKFNVTSQTPEAECFKQCKFAMSLNTTPGTIFYNKIPSPQDGNNCYCVKEQSSDARISKCVDTDANSVWWSSYPPPVFPICST